MQDFRDIFISASFMGEYAMSVTFSPMFVQRIYRISV